MTQPAPDSDESRLSGDELGARGYVDIHAHLIPGVDDGPSDLEEAVDMARAAVKAGIGTMATTPHLRSDFPYVRLEEIAPRCETLSQILAREGIPLQVIPAAEVSLTWAMEASDEELAIASYGQRGTDLLIEPPFSPVVGLERFLYTLQSKGYRVILAHPERSSQFRREDRLVWELVEQGILLQVNAGSLLASGPARGRTRLARTLLQEGLAHVIASDGHRGSHWRPVSVLRDAIAASRALVGGDRANWLAKTAPRAILAGGELPAAPPIEPAPRRRWFRLG